MSEEHDLRIFETQELREMDANMRAAIAEIAPRQEFLDIYLPRMRAEAARAVAVDASGDDCSVTVGARSAGRPARSRRWYAAIALATAAVLVLAIGGEVLWGVVRPEAVSAQAILTRAGQVANNPGLTVHSDSYVTLTRMTTGDVQDGGVNAIEYRNWYEAPDKVRLESYVKSSSAPDALNVLNIQNGAARWEYVPRFQRITRKPPLPVTAVYAGASDVRTLLENMAARDTDAKLLGTMTFGGREAYIVEITLNASLNPLYPAGSRMRLYIDKATYIGLGSETHDVQGTVIGSSSASQMQLNQPIDPMLFTLTPAAGTEVVNDTGQAAPDTATYARQLAAGAGVTGFPLLVPRDVPASLAPRAPLVEPGLAALGYAIAEQMVGDALHDPPPLTVTERRTLPADTATVQGWDPVPTQGNGMAWYQETRSSTGFVSASRLVVMQDGVTVTIVSAASMRPQLPGTPPPPVLSRAQLLAVAASLEPQPH